MVPRVVLVRVRNPLNIGAAARAMANFGLTDLVLVSPYSEAWKTARSARAGATILERARVVETLPAALADCPVVIGTTAGTARTPELPLEDWRGVAASLDSLPTAIVFGSEKTGLDRSDISHCHRLARIPTAAGAPSMNLGQAVAVCAYELMRQRPQAPPPMAEPAPIAAPEAERVLEAWHPLLERMGVLRPGHRASQSRRLRETLNRWHISPADARLLLGVARQLRHCLDGNRQVP